MIKKLLSLVIAGAVVKVVRDKLANTHDNDAELWAEATDSVDAQR
ncbi:MAG: DLW-39 family protein [Nocardioidaceae bacterium]